MMEEAVKNVTEYLEKITEIIESMNSNYKQHVFSKFAFRGEQQIFDTSGQPAIFRDYSKKIESGDHFERNLLYEMMSNNLTQGDSELLKAIDAQHDGFPSRLLDISYNSLIALFFAVTPHYTKNVDSVDDKDGQVIVYGIDKLYSVYDEGLINLYVDNLQGNNESIKETYDHKFIDQVRTNKRVIAQDGGFVLFFGRFFNAIPDWQTQTIQIDKEYKKKIRSELQKLFGIDMGYVYPEPSNKVNTILDATKSLAEVSPNDTEDNIRNLIEHNLFLYKDELFEECKIYMNKCVKGEKIGLKFEEQKLTKLIIKIEKYGISWNNVNLEDVRFKELEITFQRTFQNILDVMINNHSYVGSTDWCINFKLG